MFLLKVQVVCILGFGNQRVSIINTKFCYGSMTWAESHQGKTELLIKDGQGRDGCQENGEHTLKRNPQHLSETCSLLQAHLNMIHAKVWPPDANKRNSDAGKD